MSFLWSAYCHVSPQPPHFCAFYCLKWSPNVVVKCWLVCQVSENWCALWRKCVDKLHLGMGYSAVSHEVLVNELTTCVKQSVFKKKHTWNKVRSVDENETRGLQESTEPCVSFRSNGLVFCNSVFTVTWWNTAMVNNNRPFLCLKAETCIIAKINSSQKINFVC